MKLAFLLLLCVAAAVAETLPTSRTISFGRKLQAPTCSSYRGTDWYGNDLHSDPYLGLGSAYKCCDKCKNTSGCIAYIYRLDHDHCWLKQKLGNPSPCDVCDGQNFKEPRPNPSCNAVYGYDRPGGDMPNMPKIFKTPGECCHACKNTYGCKAWLWRRDYNHCYLKNVRNNVVSCPACVRGDI